ncbi:MAG: hypothetical protein Fur0023_14670 [Bacteroidia bacterium]
MQRLLVIMLFTLVYFLSYSQTPNPNQNPKDTPIPFTLSDKERLIKIEAKTESLEQQIQGIRDEIQEIRNEIQEIRSDIKWLAGMFLTSIIALVGFILWDRRTFLKPFESKAKEIDATLDDIKKDSRTLNKLIEALKEKSQQDEHLASILRKHHLL